MTSITRHMKETITHWVNLGSDGYGGYTYAVPVTMKARWEYTAVEFIGIDGEESVSQSIVYTEKNVSEGDILAEGDLSATSDPDTVKDAKPVRQFQRNTDLRNLDNIRKAFL